VGACWNCSLAHDHGWLFAGALLLSAAESLRSSIDGACGLAVNDLRHGLRDVSVQMEEAQSSMSELEDTCLEHVARFHSSLATATERSRSLFPEDSAAGFFGAMIVACTTACVLSCLLMCVGAPGTGFPSDLGLRLGVGLDTPPPAPEAPPPTDSSARTRRPRASSGTAHDLPHATTASAKAAPWAEPPRTGGQGKFLWMLTVATSLVLAVGTGYFAVRVAFGMGMPGVAVERCLQPVQPSWLVHVEQDAVKHGATGAKGGSLEDHVGYVFGMEVPPRCTAALQQSFVAWRGGDDFARVRLSLLPQGALVALGNALRVPGSEASLTKLSHAESGAECWVPWPLSQLMNDPYQNAAAQAHSELLDSLEQEERRARGAGKEVGLVAASKVEGVLDSFDCGSFMVQSQVGVSRSTIVFVAIAIIVFVGLQIVRESVIDAAGLGLRWRVSDLGLDLGINTRINLDVDEDQAAAAKKRN
jgi:hypothetical protein